MKKYLLVFLSLVTLSFSQDMQMKAPSQADMQNMMKQMQDMQMCMAKLDKTGMQKIQEESMAMQKKVKKMCSAGKRAQAQKTAMAFSKKMMNKPFMKQMKKCTKPFENSKFNPDKDEDDDLEKGHVCDIGFDSPDM